MPSTIEDAHRRYRDRGLVSLAINLGEERAWLTGWTEEQGVTSKVALDATGDVARAYRIEYTPTVFLVGRNGKLIGRAVGTRDWLGEHERALLERLLAP